MYSHVIIGTNDQERARAFYDPVMGALGLDKALTHGHRLFYPNGAYNFAVSLPNPGEPPHQANGGVLGFRCDSSAQVDAWHAAGVANGGTSLQAPTETVSPSLGKLYMAAMRDPDGNTLNALYAPGP